MRCSGHRDLIFLQQPLDFRDGRRLAICQLFFDIIPGSVADVSLLRSSIHADAQSAAQDNHPVTQEPGIWIARWVFVRSWGLGFEPFGTPAGFPDHIVEPEVAVLEGARGKENSLAFQHIQVVLNICFVTVNAPGHDVGINSFPGCKQNKRPQI